MDRKIYYNKKGQEKIVFYFDSDTIYKTSKFSYYSDGELKKSITKYANKQANETNLEFYYSDGELKKWINKKGSVIKKYSFSRDDFELSVHGGGEFPPECYAPIREEVAFHKNGLLKEESITIRFEPYIESDQKTPLPIINTFTYDYTYRLGNP
ncbi:MAG: hypothetical protein MK212_10310 [Saprospiraceae bacterium]|nr:hypothetical protein [Saprospiraceae bacterium]